GTHECVRHAGRNVAIRIIYGTLSLHLENSQGKLKVQFQCFTLRQVVPHLLTSQGFLFASLLLAWSS
ncbi:MAG: hypothetical protein WAN37_06375, partial [Bryobacteraceae bacterium]